MKTRVTLMIASFVSLTLTSAHAGVVLSGGGLTLVEEGPVAAAAGDPVPASLALSGTPFALDELAAFGHFTSELNDGFYGNAFSWIGGGATGTDGPFAGISLGDTVHVIDGIAFGRSNVLSGDPCSGGVCTDRTLGLYTLQFTQVSFPTAGDVTTGDPSTGWADIGTLDYQSAGGTNFAFPHRRHRYTFDPVLATGIRLLVPATGLSGGTAIDEIELFGSIVPEPSTGSILLLGLAGWLGVHRRRRNA